MDLGWFGDKRLEDDTSRCQDLRGVLEIRGYKAIAVPFEISKERTSRSRIY
jgi:hypothetical protein